MKRFLVTNDDGVFASGLLALVDVLQHFGKVYVVAPDKERSAVSQSITLRQPIEAKEVNIFGYGVQAWAVNGTPSDAVKLGCDILIEEPIDVVFSGMNLGANVGRDLLYSGTISGAREAVGYGIPAVAVSYDYYDIESVKFKKAADRLYEWLHLILDEIIESRCIWNVNIPSIDNDKYSGIAWAKLDLSIQRYKHIVSEGPNGRTIYWLTDIKKDTVSTDFKSDFYLLSQHYMTVSTWNPFQVNYELKSREQWTEKMKGYTSMKLGGIIK